MLDVTGSPSLVTLVQVCAYRGIPHAYDRRRAFAVEHMPVPPGPGPRHSTQSRYYTRQSEVHTSHHRSAVVMFPLDPKRSRTAAVADAVLRGNVFAVYRATGGPLGPRPGGLFMYYSD